MRSHLDQQIAPTRKGRRLSAVAVAFVVAVVCVLAPLVATAEPSPAPGADDWGVDAPKELQLVPHAYDQHESAVSYHQAVGTVTNSPEEFVSLDDVDYDESLQLWDSVDSVFSTILIGAGVPLYAGLDVVGNESGPLLGSLLGENRAEVEQDTLEDNFDQTIERALHISRAVDGSSTPVDPVMVRFLTLEF